MIKLLSHPSSIPVATTASNYLAIFDLVLVACSQSPFARQLDGEHAAQTRSLTYRRPDVAGWCSVSPGQISRHPPDVLRFPRICYSRY